MLPVDEAQLLGLAVDVPEIFGLGFTVTNDVVVFLQPVVVIVPVTVYVVVDVGLAVTEVPVPALNPVVGVQVYVSAPEAVKVTDSPSQMVAPLTETLGLGFTVIVNEMGFPKHPFALGVTVMVATIGVVPEFVTTKGVMFPFPLAAKPINGLLFTQLYVVLATVDPVNKMAVVVASLKST